MASTKAVLLGGKFEWSIEIDIGDIPELGQRMPCNTFKDKSKLACFT